MSAYSDSVYVNQSVRQPPKAKGEDNPVYADVPEDNQDYTDLATCKGDNVYAEPYTISDTKIKQESIQMDTIGTPDTTQHIRK